MSEQIIKKMPFSLEAEQSVLGSVLIDPEKFSSISTLITGEDFYLEEHRQIYYAMQELFLQSHKIDLVTLLEALVHQGVYDETRCKAYVREIAETVPSAANIVDYAKIVKEKEFQVNSVHTYVGTVIPKTLSVVAFSDDGQVEVVDAKNKRFFIGVKYHPELLVDIDEKQNNIFCEFIKACKKK